MTLVPPPAAMPWFRFRAAYFFFFAYLGSLAPWMTTWLQGGRLGLSTNEASVHMALLMASGPLVGFFGGRLADRRRVRARLSRGLAVVAALLPLAWWGLPAETLIVLPILQGACLSPQIVLLDATTFDALEPARHRYGSVRVAGTLGFGVGTVASGQLAEWHPDGILWTAFVVGNLFHLVAWSLPDTQEGGTTAGPRPGLRALLAIPGYAILLAATALHGFAFAHYEAFGVPHMIDHGVRPGIAGFVRVTGLLCETLMILLAPRLLGRAGPRVHRMIALGMAMNALRWSLVPFLEGFPAFALVETLHAFGFGLWFVASLHLLSLTVPRPARTVGQAVFVAAFALGQAAGARFAGYGREALGPGPTFWIDAAIALAAAAVALFAGRRMLVRPGARDPHSSAGPLER